MNGWVLLLIAAAFFAALLSVWVRIRIVASPETRVFLRVFLFTFPIYPRKKKKVRPMKSWPKEKTKKTKRTGKKKKAESSSGEKKEKKSFSSTLFLVKRVLKVVGVFFAKFPKHLHVDLRRLVVCVASPDAAKTAIEYGLVSQALAYLAELIDRKSHLHIRKKDTVSVSADFTSEKSRVEIDLTLRIRILHLLTLAIHSLIAYLKTKEPEGDSQKSGKDSRTPTKDKTQESEATLWNSTPTAKAK